MRTKKVSAPVRCSFAAEVLETVGILTKRKLIFAFPFVDF
jgi:hypothetical protein